jgi:hypothetical protein
MPESAEIVALVGEGYLRLVDLPSVLGGTWQRCQQLTERGDFPRPAKVIRSRRLWDSAEVESWRDARPRAWEPSGG